MSTKAGLGASRLVNNRAKIMKRKTLVGAIAISLILVAGIILLVGFLFSSQTGCFDPGISCPDTGDIVNGPLTVNASQYNFYQFSIPYGAQGINVHAQWSSGGSIGVYIVNATELISWQGGFGLHSYYSSGQSTNGDVSLNLPSDDLYYLVYDNTFSSVAKNIQTSSGFSYMCNLCGATPIQQENPSYPTCVPLNGSEACSAILSNTGNLETSPTGVCIQSWSLREGPLQTWGVPRLGIFQPRTTVSPLSNTTGTCTVSGTTAPLGLAITVLIPFTDRNNIIMYGPVSLNAPTCTQSGSRLVCSFSIDNDFTPGVVATKCQIQVGDNVSSWAGTVGGVTAFNADTHGSLFTCSVTGTEPPIGTLITGLVSFSDGSYAPFSG